MHPSWVCVGYQLPFVCYRQSSTTVEFGFPISFLLCITERATTLMLQFVSYLLSERASPMIPKSSTNGIYEDHQLFSSIHAWLYCILVNSNWYDRKDMLLCPCRTRPCNTTTWRFSLAAQFSSTPVSIWEEHIGKKLLSSSSTWSLGSSTPYLANWHAFQCLINFSSIIYSCYQCLLNFFVYAYYALCTSVHNRHLHKYPAAARGVFI
jgi:hypothetical protein